MSHLILSRAHGSSRGKTSKAGSSYGCAARSAATTSSSRSAGTIVSTRSSGTRSSLPASPIAGSVPTPPKNVRARRVPGTMLVVADPPRARLEHGRPGHVERVLRHEPDELHATHGETEPISLRVTGPYSGCERSPETIRISTTSLHPGRLEIGIWLVLCDNQRRMRR